MHYQENLQQNVEIIQLSVHMFEESLGKKIPMLDKVGWNNFWICIFLPEFSLTSESVVSSFAFKCWQLFAGVWHCQFTAFLNPYDFIKKSSK